MNKEDLLADDLDEEDLAAIEEGLAQLNRGEVLDWKEYSSKIRAIPEVRTGPAYTGKASIPV